MSTYADRLSQLRARLTDVGKQLSSLADRRKSFSLAAATGDATARKQIADTDAEAEALRREEQTISAAVETAVALDKQQELEAQAAEEHARQVDAHRHAQGVIALNLEIDAALVHLREMFERRAVLLAGLARTNIVDGLFVGRLAGKAGPTRAACHAGLAKFIALEHPSPQSVRPLADTNTILVGIGAPPEAESPPAPRLGRKRKEGSDQ